jgi:hypothetical protein
MYISVTQVLEKGTQWIDVNTDQIESVREFTAGGHIVLHMISGRLIEINENRAWWEQHAARR